MGIPIEITFDGDAYAGSFDANQDLVGFDLRDG